MSTEVGEVIAGVLAAAGEGMATLRDLGTSVALQDCTIEVMVHDLSDMSALVRVNIAATPSIGSGQPE